MAHPRWPGFNTKTGDPQFDNASMRLNRRIWRETQASVKVRARNRKRKKHVLRVEGGTYITLWVAVTERLAAQHRNDAAM